MAKSYITFTGDGSTSLFNFPFAWMSRDHVFASVDGTEASFSWINNSLISITPPPAAGAQVKVYRKTPTSPLTVFSAASSLKSDAMNNTLRQPLLLAEEAADNSAQNQSSSLHLGVADYAPTELPFNRANKVLGFGNSKEPIAIDNQNPDVQLGRILSERVSITDFAGCDPTGVAASNAALTAALAVSDHVILPRGVRIRLQDFHLTQSGKIIECIGDASFVGTPNHFLLSLDGTDNELRNFNAKGAYDPLADNGTTKARSAYSACIITNERNRINGGKITGDWVYPIEFALGTGTAGNNGSVRGTYFDGGAAVQTNAAIQINSCNDVEVFDNVFNDYLCFGVQALTDVSLSTLNTGNRIVRNSFIGKMRSQSATGNGSSTTFDVTFPIGVTRFSVWKDGVPFSNASWTVAHLDSDNKQYRFTFTSAPANGSALVFNAWRSFEAVNLNRNTSRAQVLDNYIQAAGDSGIVLCTDFGGTAASDCYVARNRVEFCANCGIAETSLPTSGNSYVDNEVESCAYLRSDTASADVYNAGILLTGSTGTFRGGRVSNKVKGTMRHGVMFNSPLGVVAGNDGVAWEYEPPKFAGPFIHPTNCQQTSTSALTQGIAYRGGRALSYGVIPLETAWANAPASDATFSYGPSGGTGWTRDTTGSPPNTVAWAKTVANNYVDISLAKPQLIGDAVLEITVLGKAASYTDDAHASYVQPFVMVGGTPVAGTAQLFRDTTKLERHTFYIPMAGSDRFYSLRIGAPASGDLAFIGDIQFTYRPIV